MRRNRYLLILWDPARVRRRTLPHPPPRGASPQSSPIFAAGAAETRRSESELLGQQVEVSQLASENHLVYVADSRMGSVEDVFIDHREVGLVGHELDLDFVVGCLARLRVLSIATESDVGVDDVVVVDGAVHARADGVAIVDDAGVVGVARGGEPAGDDHVIAFTCLAHLDDLGVDHGRHLDEVDAKGRLDLVLDVVGDLHAVRDVADVKLDDFGRELGPELGRKEGEFCLGFLAVEVPGLVAELGKGSAGGGALDVAEEAGLHHLVGEGRVAVEEVNLPDEGRGIDGIENRVAQVGRIADGVVAGKVELAVLPLSDEVGVHAEHAVPDREAGLGGDVDPRALDAGKVKLGEIESHVHFAGNQDVVDLGLFGHSPELDVLESHFTDIAPPGVVAGYVDFLWIRPGNELVGARARDDLGAVVGAGGVDGFLVFHAGAVVGEDVEGGTIGRGSHIFGSVRPRSEGSRREFRILELAPDDLHGVFIDFLHGENGAEHGLGTRLGMVKDAVEREHDIVCVEGASIMEFDALAQFDRVGRPVLGNEAVLQRRDCFRQARVKLEIGRHVDQCLVDLAHDLGFVQGRVDVRVKRLGCGREDEYEGLRVPVPQRRSFRALGKQAGAKEKRDEKNSHQFLHVRLLQNNFESSRPLRDPQYAIK